MKKMVLPLILFLSLNSIGQIFQADSAYKQNQVLCGASAAYIQKANNEAWARALPQLSDPFTPIVGFPPAGIQVCGKFRLFYEDFVVNVNEGFQDATLGLARRNTFCAVLNYVQSVLQINLPANDFIDIHVRRSYNNTNFQPPPNLAGALAMAGPYYPVNYCQSCLPAGVFNGHAYNHIFNGVDPDPLQYDMEVRVNFSGTLIINSQPVPFSYWDDYLNTTGRCKYDLFSILLHETTHGLGFISNINEDVNYNIQSANNNNQFSLYDWQFLYYNTANNNLTAAGNFQKLVQGPNPGNPSINPAVNTFSQPIRTQNVWTYNSNRPLNQPVYSGNYSNLVNTTSGLSVMSLLSHLDEQVDAFSVRGRISPGFSPLYSMSPFSYIGQMKRTWSFQEIRMLMALGYTLNPSYVNLSIVTNNVPPTFNPGNAALKYTELYNNNNNLFTVYPEGPQPNTLTMVNNSNSPVLIIPVSTDPNFVDANGDVMTIEPGSLINIRGCGVGGNNTNGLQIINNGQSITYTPRTNFYGRAQFGFHLTDGKERGSFVVYTIDVTRGINFQNTPATELVLNGSYEEGTEVKQIGANEFLPNSVFDFGLEGRYCTGLYMGDAHPFGHFGLYTTPCGGGDLVFNSASFCDLNQLNNATQYKGSFGSRHQTWPSPISPFPPGTSIPPGTERFHHLDQSFNYQSLAADATKCNRYILEFDIAPYNSTVPLNGQVNFSVQFTNQPVVTNPTWNFTTPASFTCNNLTGWQHVIVPFVYCGSTPSQYMNLGNFSIGYYQGIIDNISLRLDNSYPPMAINISPSGNQAICAGQSVALTASVVNPRCGNTYSWAPSTGLNTTAGPNVIASPSTTTTYTVFATDNAGCGTVTNTITITVLPPTVCNACVVPNGDFEYYTSCPTTIGQITNVPLWMNANTGTADYFNSCAPNNTGVSTPANSFGTEIPSSGNGYAGEYFYIPGPANGREYIEIPLNCPLQQGQLWNVSTKVSLAENSGFQVNNLGIYLSPTQVFQNNAGFINVTPQANISTVVSNSNGWTTISNSSYPGNNEQYAVVGNFFANNNPSTIAQSNPNGFLNGAYYYIDDVKITPVPPQVTPSSATICPNGSVTLTASGSPGYSWAPSSGLNTTSGPVVVASPSVTTTYTVYAVLNCTNCIVSNTVTVTVVQCSGNTIIDNPNSNTFIINNASPPTVLQDPVSIGIVDNIDIQAGSFTMICPDVRVSGGRRITVRNGATLTIQRTWMHACGCMWDGIFVEGGGTLIIGNNTTCIIEDAQNAVITQQVINSTAPAPIWQISSTIFNKNAIGCQFQSHPNSNALLSNYVRNCVFTCRVLPSTAVTLTNFNTIKTAIAGANSGYAQTTTLDGLRSEIGIRSNENKINIGDPANSGYLNVFDYNDFGIFLSGSDAVIQNNRFTHIDGRQAGRSVFGICIYGTLQGYSVYPPLPDAIIGQYPAGNNPNAVNSFQDFFRAVEIHGFSKVRTINNTFNNTATLPQGPTTIGDHAQFYTDINELLVVTDNTISNCETGINYFRNTANPAVLNTTYQIDRNTLDIAAPGFMRYGIMVSDIANNNITTNGGSISANFVSNCDIFCIKASNIQNLLNMFNNALMIKHQPAPNSQYDIWLEFCQNTHVVGNACLSTFSTTYNAANGGNWNLRGIYVDNSTSVELKCNGILRTGRCIEFNGNCFSPTAAGSFGVLSNTFYNSRTGLFLNSNAIIGNQGSAGNPIGDSWLGAPTAYDMGQTWDDVPVTTNSTMNQLFCLFPSATQFPDPCCQQGAFPYVPLLNGLVPTSGTPPSCPPPCFNCTTLVASPLAAQLQAIVQNTSLITPFDQAAQWMRSNSAFRSLIANPFLMQQNAVLQNFFTGTQPAPMGRLAAVDTSISNRQFSNANIINNAVAASTIVEQNQKLFNSINLKLLMNPQYQFTMQDSIDLANIAGQCPLAGGNAVIQARNLAMRIANKMLVFGNTCASALREMENNDAGAQVNASKFRLFPNPNNGIMTLEYDLPENMGGEVIIYDLTGQAIAKQMLPANDKQANIIIRDIAEGVYFYSVKVNGLTAYSGKVVIIK